ncbi:MAG: hypothetical protein QM772_17810 [Ottowia sp.]|uniref:hypothetical protein n=1 Tax=Ottowia sp. TaxID=1898956 RepID=UPI0039E2940D
MATPPESLPPEVAAAFQRGEPVEAIKLLLKLRAGAPGRPAPGRKPAAPAAPKPRKAAPPPKLGAFREGLSPGEVPRSASAVTGWAIVALLAYLAYRLLAG